MLPRRGAFALIFTAVGLILLLNFKTPSAPANLALGATVAQAPSSAGAITGTTVGSTSTQSTTSSTTSGAARSGTYTGTAVPTYDGTIQVQITVSNGKLTAIQMLQYPTSGRSSQISQAAIPTLIQEALQAQSAQINAVSGATYTSQGFAQSLQSALVQANV
jgi:uncharacterized protein with FMN-binding domain